MAVLPPHIQTYHCLCTSLILATTHKLSNLPRRKSSFLDASFILPIPFSAPNYSSQPSPSPLAQSRNSDAQDDNGAGRTDDDTHMAERKEEDDDPCMPDEGYTLLLDMVQDRKPLVVRGEDGFEKRLLWRCGRCRLIIGYGITGADYLGREVGKEVAGDFQGNVVYLLPNGVMSTDTMVDGARQGKAALEEDVDIPGSRFGVFE